MMRQKLISLGEYQHDSPARTDAADNNNTTTTLTPTFSLTPSKSLARAVTVNEDADSLQATTITNDEYWKYKNKTYCFIHIGKAAGSKVSCELGEYKDQFIIFCNGRGQPARSTYKSSFNITPENNLWKYKGRRKLPSGKDRLSHHHTFTKSGQCGNEDIFLISIRHPISRIISFFEYEKPRINDHNKAPKLFDWLLNTKDGIIHNKNDILFALSRHNETITKGVKHPSCSYLFFYNNNGDNMDGVTIAKKSDTDDDTVFRGCFSTVSEFLESIDAKLSTSTSTTTMDEAFNKTIFCSMLAWEVVRGTIPCDEHNYYNYHWYVQKTIIERYFKAFSSKIYPLVVVRQEHLAEDFHRLKYLFGDIDTDAYNTGIIDNANAGNEVSVINKGNGGVRTESNDDNAKDGFMKNYNVSKDGMHKLCSAMCNEIQQYKWIIDHSDSFTSQQKEQSLEELYDVCPSQICTDV